MLTSYLSTINYELLTVFLDSKLQKTKQRFVLLLYWGILVHFP